MNFFDLHCDSPYESMRRNQSFQNGDLAVTADKGSVFDFWREICAVWIPDEHPFPRRRYKEILDNFKCQIKTAENVDDLAENRAFLLSLEGASLIESEADVDMLYNDGIMAVTLTWNGKNKIAGGVNTAGRFTEFGRRIVRRMNDRVIAADLSHLNDRSFFDVISEAEYVFASHTACRSICHVRRNMTDEQLSAIAEKGGIIGLCLYPKFLGEGDTFENLYRHISHMISMGLEQNIAIGSDFDGAKMDKRLDTVDKIVILYKYLKNKGLSEDVLERLFYKNAQNYFCGLLKLRSDKNELHQHKRQ
ncbi:MAG: hypothetical protein E7550_04230 [Ruminococcaceae bacterium]|nr:hypothetical protein [Oscillospiraceae bacterium]